MIRSFDGNSTTDDVLDGMDLRGKRVLVTDASSGLGFETARALAAHGAAVTGTARDLEKGQRATAAAGDAVRRGGGSFDLVEMDLADLSSVRSVAQSLVEAGEPLDLLVANAGVMAPPFGHTKDGFELQFGTNFLGHFVLADRLAPLMREGARLLVLSSNTHRMADIDLDDLNWERRPYDPWAAYGASKTADALLAVAFDARNGARGVRAASVHPGTIQTDITRSLDPATFQAAFAAMSEHHVALGNPPLVPKTIPQGAATTVWAGIVADADAIGGRYCEDCGVGRVLDDANVSSFAPGFLSYAANPARADALRERTNELVGERR